MAKKTVIHKVYALVKKLMPASISSVIRKIATAVLTPIRFSYQSGHFRSSLKGLAVDKNGNPIPWYTYPSIDFLKLRDYSGESVLEFGSGQSTLWWASRARSVIAIEENEGWYKKMRASIPENVQLHLVSMESPEACVSQVADHLSTIAEHSMGVAIIDGLYRKQMIAIAQRYVHDGGIIIVDNSDGYGIREGFMGSGMRRVDFYGQAPGVMLAHCTSIYFNDKTRLFDNALPIEATA